MLCHCRLYTHRALLVVVTLPRESTSSTDGGITFCCRVFVVQTLGLKLYTHTHIHIYTHPYNPLTQSQVGSQVFRKGAVHTVGVSVRGGRLSCLRRHAWKQFVSCMYILHVCVCVCSFARIYMVQVMRETVYLFTIY